MSRKAQFAASRPGAEQPHRWIHCWSSTGSESQQVMGWNWSKTKPSGKRQCTPWGLRDGWGQGHRMRNSHPSPTPGRRDRDRDTDRAQAHSGQRYHQIYIIYIQLLQPSWAEGRLPWPLKPPQPPQSPRGAGQGQPGVPPKDPTPTLPPAPPPWLGGHEKDGASESTTRGGQRSPTQQETPSALG